MSLWGIICLNMTSPTEQDEGEFKAIARESGGQTSEKREAKMKL